MRMNKKGEATDSIVFGFWIFVIGLVLIFLVYAFGEVLTSMGDSALASDANALNAINSANNYISVGLPGTFVVIFFGLLMGMLVSSYFIRVHWVFIPVYILMGVGAIITAVALGNVWGALGDQEYFQQVVATNSILGAIDYVVRHIVLVTVLAFILSLTITFAKPSNQAQQGGEPF